MLRKVILKRKSINDYSSILGEEKLENLKMLAKPLKGLKVLQVNATSFGGGVAELLNSSIPLLNSLGLNVEWGLLCKEEPFFEVTKEFHNALQGKEYQLSKEAREIYLNRNHHCAKMIDQDYDVVMVHDPQPLALRHFHGKGNASWIWRCHIDTSEPSTDIWNFIKPFVEEYDAVVFTLDDFVPKDLNLPFIKMIAPAIDPFTSKNIDLDMSLCRSIVQEYGVDLSRPYLLQVSRFDPWKDPLGVMRVYQKLKCEIPELQLVFVGSMADDDPEGWEIYKEVETVAKKDNDILLFTNLSGVNAFEVNCFQRMASVVIQKSIREGFGLVVSEALWKGAPIVAGNVGGIPLQIEQGVNGYLADTEKEYVDYLLLLLRDDTLREKISKKGRESVSENFLMTRLIKEEMELYKNLLKK